MKLRSFTDATQFFCDKNSVKSTFQTKEAQSLVLLKFFSKINSRACALTISSLQKFREIKVINCAENCFHEIFLK